MFVCDHSSRHQRSLPNFNSGTSYVVGGGHMVVVENNENQPILLFRYEDLLISQMYLVSILCQECIGMNQSCQDHSDLRSASCFT